MKNVSGSKLTQSQFQQIDTKNTKKSESLEVNELNTKLDINKIQRSLCEKLKLDENKGPHIVLTIENIVKEICAS